MNFSYHLPLWPSVVLFIDYLSKTAIQIICKSTPDCLSENRKTKIGNWSFFAKVAHFTYMLVLHEYKLLKLEHRKMVIVNAILVFNHMLIK